MFNLLKFMSILLLVPVVIMAQLPERIITDSFIGPASNGQDPIRTLDRDTVYVLNGFVYVENGCVLTIEPGTVIKGYSRTQVTTGDRTSALIIARGGQIFANGTATEPIIFTAYADDLNNPFDLGPNDRGLWGGVLLCGRDSINFDNGTTLRYEKNIEGIAATEQRALYGAGSTLNGTYQYVPHDNSGILRYVSIRHGGDELAPADEINGLTMGGVGDGTTIEYIEVYANLDDGFEWFGGNVNTKYLVTSFNIDDDFDYDIGFNGKHQFWFSIKDPIVGGGRFGEYDGGDAPSTTNLPYAIPIVSNFTFIGAGLTATPSGDGGQALIFRANGGGKHYNGILTEYKGGTGGSGITVEDVTGQDSRQRLEDGDLVINNNIWWLFSAGNDLATIVPQSFVQPFFTAGGNDIVDPQINSIDRSVNGLLDPRPAASSPAATGGDFSPAPLNDPFFDVVDYQGAFDPNLPMWILGWTALDQEGILKPTTQNVIASWNMISLPVAPKNTSVSTLYPTSTPGTAYGWNGTYVPTSSFNFGSGYWLRFPSATTISMRGAALLSRTYNLTAGWNMIGAVSAPVAASSISDPSGIIVAGTLYGWTGTYTTATSLVPGQGYWIRASAAGTISINAGAASSPVMLAKLSNLVDISQNASITVSDARGYSQELYVDVQLTPEVDRMSYQLPPLPPAGSFDARFAGDMRLVESEEGIIRLQGSYPITLTARGADYVVEELVTDGRSYHVAAGSSVTISNSQLKSVKVVKSTVSMVPSSFVVEQNYPNPFNPTTTISYSLPSESKVEVIVFNALGQEVKTLVSANQPAGRYTVSWDGTNAQGVSVSSGIYYYQVIAGDHSSIMKMVLMK